MELKEWQNRIKLLYKEAFGESCLSEQFQDVRKEHQELQNAQFLTPSKVREELGDLLSTTIEIANKYEWNIEEVLNENLKKIENRMVSYKKRGRKINVGILGGAFDPIHNGHLEIARNVLANLSFMDEIWLMPTYYSLSGKNLSEIDHRLKMCNLIAKENNRIKVFDYEIRNELDGETYNTIKRLIYEDEYKDKYRFYYIIGLDNALSAPTSWNHFDLTTKSIIFITIPRGNYKPTINDWFVRDEHIYLPHVSIPDFSSTIVKQRILAKDEEYLKISLHSKVLEYIRENKLYGMK